MLIEFWERSVIVVIVGVWREPGVPDRRKERLQLKVW